MSDLGGGSSEHGYQCFTCGTLYVRQSSVKPCPSCGEPVCQKCREKEHPPKHERYGSAPAPGQWIADKKPTGKLQYICAGGRIIAAVYVRESVTRGGKSELIDLFDGKANLALIASAPILLEAARDTLGALNNMTTEEFRLGGDRAIRTKLESAIRQAKGEE